MRRTVLPLLWSLAAGSPALAHDIEATIPDCSVNVDCFTDDVWNLSHDDRRFWFSSKGLPDASHPLMRGISGSNQRFPTAHDFRFELPRDPKRASHPTPTRPGPIGVAVNGVPIFDPSTQGPLQSLTGKPVSAAEAGELDECGGHAGRGDDYHYHVAPKCLINELGKTAVEDLARPIGYAADGFPILALGWFEPEHDIEGLLDSCRGATDAKGHYFYNVEHGGDHAVLKCFSGTERGFARDRWTQRRDAQGRAIIGLPIHFDIIEAYDDPQGNQTCHVMIGVLRGERVLPATGAAMRVTAREGAIFYCDPGCYGQFSEVQAPGVGGRTVSFELETRSCASGFEPAEKNAFLAYHREGITYPRDPPGQGEPPSRR